MENEKSSLIKLAIVDNDRLMVQLLTNFLEQNQELKVVFTADNGNQFLEKLQRGEESIDVVLLDLNLAEVSGFKMVEEYLKKLEGKKIKTIVLSNFYSPSLFVQMLRLGVDAFLPKELEKEELLEVIMEMHEKGYWFSIDQMLGVRKQSSTKTPQLHQLQKNSLTIREVEVLELLCRQLTTQEIAERMFVSSKTIEVHKANLLMKTGTKNSAGLILYAVENKLIDPRELMLL